MAHLIDLFAEQHQDECERFYFDWVFGHVACCTFEEFDANTGCPLCGVEERP